MTRHDTINGSPSGPAERDHEALRDLLTEYATAAALGGDSSVVHPEIEAHLESCADCQAELAELLELVAPAYAGEVPAAPWYPAPSLSFLASLTNRVEGTVQGSQLLLKGGEGGAQYASGGDTDSSPSAQNDIGSAAQRDRDWAAQDRMMRAAQNDRLEIGADHGTGSQARGPAEGLEQARSRALDRLRGMVIEFSQTLLDALRQPSLAGAVRGSLLLRYMREPVSESEPGVTIEVTAEDESAGAGRVCVCVELADRNPFDQGGSQVRLEVGSTTWRGETDETGSVDFSPVPLDLLPGLRVEITPPAEV